MKRFIVYFPDYLHKIAKLLCVNENKAMTNYIVELVEADLKKRGLV